MSRLAGRAHGALTPDRARRWCAACKHEHGVGYACPHYDAATLEEITADTKDLFAAMETPGWRARQMANGVPRVVLDIFDELWGVASQ